jgi:excisionase family DNA binding protein
MASEKTERLSYSVREFARLTSLGKNRIYAAIRRGELRSFKVDRRRLISAEAARDFIALRERLTAEGGR